MTTFLGDSITFVICKEKEKYIKIEKIIYIYIYINILIALISVIAFHVL